MAEEMVSAESEKGPVVIVSYFESSISFTNLIMVVFWRPILVAAT
jgi:hypothetical protein